MYYHFKVYIGDTSNVGIWKSHSPILHFDVRHERVTPKQAKDLLHVRHSDRIKDGLNMPRVQLEP